MSHSAETSFNKSQQQKKKNDRLDLSGRAMEPHFSEEKFAITSLQKLNVEARQTKLDRDLDRTAFQSILAEHQNEFDLYKAEVNRKLAKLTDENWAKDLENQTLRNQLAAEDTVAMRFKAEQSLHQSKLDEVIDRKLELEQQLTDREKELASIRENAARALREVNTSHLRETESLQETNSAMRVQMNRLCVERAEIENDFDRSKQSFEAAYAALLKEKNQEVERSVSERERFALERERTLAEHEQKITQLRHDFESRIKDITLKRDNESEAFRMRESQLSSDLSKQKALTTQAECALKDSTDNAAKKQTELQQQLDTIRSQMVEQATTLKGQAAEALREADARLERALLEQSAEMQSAFQAKLQEIQDEFQKQFEIVMAENKKFRQMLDVRDTQIEVDRSNLKQWQEQLNFLDQHLRQSKDAFKRDRSELLKLSKAMASELEAIRNHPFKDYIEFWEIEVGKVQALFNNTSPLSPMRGKLEERIAQMIESRDGLKAALSETVRQIDERIQSVQTITKSAVASI